MSRGAKIERVAVFLHFDDVISHLYQLQSRQLLASRLSDCPDELLYTAMRYNKHYSKTKRATQAHARSYAVRTERIRIRDYEPKRRNQAHYVEAYLGMSEQSTLRAMQSLHPDRIHEKQR